MSEGHRGRSTRRSDGAVLASAVTVVGLVLLLTAPSVGAATTMPIDRWQAPYRGETSAENTNQTGGQASSGLGPCGGTFSIPVPAYFHSARGRLGGAATVAASLAPRANCYSSFADVGSLFAFAANFTSTHGARHTLRIHWRLSWTVNLTAHNSSPGSYSYAAYGFDLTGGLIDQTTGQTWTAPTSPLLSANVYQYDNGSSTWSVNRSYSFPMLVLLTKGDVYEVWTEIVVYLDALATPGSSASASLDLGTGPVPGTFLTGITLH